MAVQNMQNHQRMDLVLSSDAKPTVKWTPELRKRFAEAVSRLGGADKASPNGLMKVTGIPGLTLYHLKSHLQKYRLGNSRQSVEFCADDHNLSSNTKMHEAEDEKEIQNRDVRFDPEVKNAYKAQPNPINPTLQIAQTLQMQMEVQRKLHEQIEVQKHLQLRIEAQGKYLRSVLKKAQETLAGYCPSSAVVKAELSQFVYMVHSGPTGSSSSELSELGDPKTSDSVKRHLQEMCSVESSLTYSESSGLKQEEKEPKNEKCITQEQSYSNFTKLCLTDILPCKTSQTLRVQSKKRKSIPKEENNKLRKYEMAKGLDLNRQYQSELGSGPEANNMNNQETENCSSGRSR